MIYLAYERELITKAEIDTMLKQVDEFDGSCLSVGMQYIPDEGSEPALRSGLLSEGHPSFS
jgi:hypothetical protein